MMLASNIPIKSKEDVIKTARCYLDRWRIEEYFKFKKQEYNFENFRVRTLKSINNFNKMLTYAIGLVAMLSEKIGKRKFVNKIIKESKSLKNNVYLWFYQLARGIYNILSKTRCGIREWENIKKLIKKNKILKAVYVGDTINDYKSAHKNKLHFIWAEYGFGKCDKYYKKIRDIYELTKIKI